jgi:5-methylcytosine-specific restriction endonuclease McrA
MEKITKPTVIEIPSLKALAENYIKWGEEFEQKLKNGGKSSNFSWKGGVYKEIRDQLCSITKNHCSFCDDYPIGTQSKETIEHYFPKEKYPLLSYDWENLFYCCDKCQSEANKTLFQETLKPSDAS